MRKNVASQNIAVQMNSRTDGSPLTASVSAFVTGDAGAQTAGGGTLTHKGNGHWNYAPTQAETNFNHIAFTFTHAIGVNQTVNVYTVSFDPHDTADLGLTALDVAISTRASQASLDVVDDFIDTEVAAILAAVDTEIGTIIAAVAAVQADTDDIQTRLPAALVGGRMASNAEVVGDKTGYALTAGERDSIAAAHLDLANGVETGLTVRQHDRIVQAAVAGKSSQHAAGTPKYRDLADTKNRIDATTDADGNRTAVALDAT